MENYTKSATAVIALMLIGALLVLPGAADHDLVSVELDEIYSEDFNSDDGGWNASDVPDPIPIDPQNPSWGRDEIPDGDHVTRPDPSSEWAWGEPTSGPGEAVSGTNVWATNLGGDYGSNHCAGIMSPPIDLTGATNASVAFDSWLHTEQSTFSGLLWDAALLYVTTDGGNTLTVVDPDQGYDGSMSTNARGCHDGQPSGSDGLGGPGGSTPPTGYTTISADLGAFAGQEVQFVMALSSDGIIHRDGWYVDNFAVTIDDTTVVEDFETGDGGFTVVGTEEPTVASFPDGGAHSGTQAWGTAPTSTLPATECSGLISPPMDLTNANDADVAFQHWYDMRETSFAWHGSLVFATTDGGLTLQLLEPDEGYNSETLSSASRGCLGDQPSGTTGLGGGKATDWEQLNFDLSGQLGKNNVQIVVGFRGDSSGDHTGLYIDTWETTIDGNTVVEDFETDDGGFEITGLGAEEAPLGWSWDHPTQGPAMNETHSAWATNPHGDFGPDECAWVESQPITVSGLGLIDENMDITRASLAWDQFYRGSSFSTGGVVQIGTSDGNYTILEPEGGYPADPSSSSVNDCLGHDDAGTGAMAGFINSDGDSMETWSADLSQYIGEEITVRYLFTSGSASSLGWYVSDVRVDFEVFVTDPHLPNPVDAVPESVDVPFTPLLTAYAEDFAVDDGGFTTGGTAGTWEFGTPQSPPEILPGQTPNLWGTNLDGDHGSSDCGWIQSPPIDLSTAPAGMARLNFQHWIESRISTSSGNAFSGGLVTLSSDGENFTVADPIEGYDSEGVTFGQRNCLGVESDQGNYGTLTSETPEPDAWRNASFDVSDYLGGDLHVRWFFGAGGTSITERGWYVDDINVQVGVGASVGVPEVPDLPGVNVPFTPLLSAYAEDFAEDGGGYSVGGPGTSTWEWGTPQDPPQVQPGQTPGLWGTNLDGDHDSNECNWIQSTPIDLSAFPLPSTQETMLAQLSFQHWIDARMSSFSGTAWTGGLVAVSPNGENWTVADPIEGYDSDGVFSSQASCLGVSTSQSIYSTLSTETTEADAWRNATFDVSEFLGGELHVRWFFGAGGTSITERGWYIDDVAVDVGLGVNVEPGQVPGVPGLSGAPGWTIGGSNPSWEYGVVTDDSSNVNDFRGETGFMTNLDGNSNDPECSYIESPGLPGPVVAANPSLAFEHAYRIPGASVNVAWGGGLVMASLDAGVSWQYLDLPEYDRPLDYSGGEPQCFVDFGAPITGNVFSGANTQLHTVNVNLGEHLDLTEVASAPDVRFRFVFGNVVFDYEGWFIGEVNVAGTPILD